MRNVLSDADVNFIADLLHSEAGVRLGPGKKTMIQARLIRRMQLLGIQSLGDYVDYVRYSPEGVEERSALIDILTTHKTDFFRERHHFDFLLKTGLDSLPKLGGLRVWKAWSAGCSSGEEAWTLAMVLADYFGEEEDWRFQIFGSDISEMVLETARRAVYPRSILEAVPLEYRARYLMHGRGRQSGNVRVVPELRRLTSFARENLHSADIGGDDRYELIFCRNVVIYFDREDTALLVKRLARRLVSGGYLFIGHSETINCSAVGLEPVIPTVFRKV